MHDPEVTTRALYQSCVPPDPPVKFRGRVLRVGRVLGKKNVRTDEPTERVDKKILETLVELEPGTKLPVGLRVDAFIRAKD